MRKRTLQLFILSIIPEVMADAVNITVSHLSPTINYIPSRSGSSGETWNVSYVLPQDAPNSGAIGDGPSSHYTTNEGASASLGFVGTAVYVYGYSNGTESDSDVSLSIGGKKLEKGDGNGLLGWKEGLKNQWWDLAVNVTGGGGVGIQGITFTIDFGGKGASLSNTTLFALDESNNPNGQLSFSGSWTTGTEAGLDRRPYNRVDTQGQDARAMIPTLAEQAFVIIFGSVNYDHSYYYVAPSQPIGGWPWILYTSGETPWISLNEVLYFGMVDGGVIALQNMQGGSWLDLSSIVYMTAIGGKDENAGKRKGAIIGGVIGGLAGLALLGLSVWWFFRRRGRSTAGYALSGQRDDHGPFEIDPYKETAGERQASFGSHYDNPELAYASAASGSIGSAWSDRPHLNPYESPAPYQPPPPPRTETSTPGNTYVDPFPPSTAPESSRSQERPSTHRLALVSPDGAGDDDETNAIAAGIVIPPDTERKERRRVRAPPRTGIRQETDAGPVALVPPSYDPAWAQAGLTSESPPPMSSRGGSQTDVDSRTMDSELDSLVRDRGRRSGDLGETRSLGAER